jgi:hypothetical protein
LVRLAFLHIFYVKLKLFFKTVYDVQASKGYRVILPRAISEGCGRKDVLYLALTRKSCGTSTLYFTYLCSKKLFAIKTEYLVRLFLS